MRQHRGGEYRQRQNGQNIWTYPKSIVSPGSPRDLVALGQGVLVHRSWAFLSTQPKPDLHVVPPSQPDAGSLQHIQSLQCPMGADGLLESSGAPFTRAQAGNVCSPGSLSLEC